LVPGLAHTGMVFYELSEGHREAVTEKLKSDIEQLRNDFAKANINHRTTW
jgi:hypothetical protein